MKAKLLLMLLLAVVLSTSAGAVEITIVNPGFEDPVLNDGQRTLYTTGWQEGWYYVDGTDPNLWFGYPYSAGAYNPEFDYGGVAPEGENVGYARSYTGYDMGLRQILSATLQAGWTYELSALVGNPSVYNGGTTADYRIELVAGGVRVASDTGPSPTNDTYWTTGSLSFTPDGSHAQLGKPLEIRLITVDTGDYGDEVDFDDIRLNSYADPMNPSPYNGESVYGGDVELSWTNMDPNEGVTDVYVDVWFGVNPDNPNKPGNWTHVIDANTPQGENATSVTVDAPVVEPPSTTYYWQVNSYIYGADKIDESNMIEGCIYTFYATTDKPLEYLDAGANMVTWEGEAVQLDATVVDDGVSALTYAWSANPDVGVVFSATDVEDPIVTITKPGEIPIANAGFEVPARSDGEWGYIIPPGWGWFGQDWVGNWNPSIEYGGAPPEGENFGFVEAYGVEGGLAQILTDTLEAETTYTLVVEVGNTPQYDWGGYKVQLLAGGTGTAPGEITGGTLLAEDDDTLVIAPNTFETSTVVYTCGVSDPSVGQPIQIRLIANKDGEEVDFDDVRLYTIPPRGPSPDVYSVELTLAVNDELNTTPVEDTMTIDVYETACTAARIGLSLAADNPGDINANCITGLDDLAEMLLTWTDYALTEPKVKEPPTGAVADVFSLNFYYYPWPWDSADYHTITLEEEQTAGFDTWLTDGWMNMEIPWNEDEQPPVTIKSIEGAEATYTLIHARNGGAYYWDYPRTTLLGDGNGDMMDGHANGTEDADELIDMTISDIPFGVYDVIIYVGSQEAQFFDGTGKFVFNGGPEQDFTLTSGIFDGTFTEIVDATTPGNYILFEDLVGDSFTLQMWGNGFNHLGPCGLQFGYTDTFNPSPANDGYVHPASDVELSWTNMDPNTPGDPVYVDVWFGTDPNNFGSPAGTKVLDKEQDATSVLVDASTLGETYYWQVNSYLYGDPATTSYDTNPGDPNIVEGPLWRFHTVTDVPVSVDAGYDVVAWSGREVQLDGTVEDYGEGDVEMVAWSAYPDDGVEFSDPSVEDPTVTITKATDNPSVVVLTLSGQDGVGSDEDRMRIEVYDTACLAAIIGLGQEYDPGDVDADCDTDFEDFVEMALTWLVDYELTEPVEKP